MPTNSRNTMQADEAAAPKARPSLEEIYDRELPYVWSSLRRLRVSTGDLEDLAHELFIVVHRRLADYDATRPLRPWLFGIAYRLVCEHRRRKANTVSLDGFDTPDATPAQDELLGEARDRAFVLKVLGTLEIERRAVFILHDIDGIAMPEIADALEIPLNTGYSRLRLARRDFAKGVMQLRSTSDGGR